MPLPLNVETVILHGRYVELDGDPCFPGYVLFNSNVRLRNPNADVIIVPVSIRADLDSNGEFTVTLPTTNDPDNIPEDWTYTVQENLPNFSRTYGLKLPITLADPPLIVELADLSPTVGDDPSSPELTEIAWTQVSGKPATFPPSIHNHPIAEVTSLQAILDGKAGTAHNHDGTYSPATHNHDAQYSGLAHSHSQSDVAGLELELADKSEVSHTHQIVQAPAANQSATIFRGFDSTQIEPVVKMQNHDGSFTMAEVNYGSVTFNVPINVPYFTVTNSFIIDGDGRRYYWSDTDPDLGPLGIAPLGSLWLDGPNMLIKKKTSTSPDPEVWTAQPVPVHTHSAADITSGTIAIARLPVGETATDVAVGNHTHSTGAHIHDAAEVTTGTVDFARLPTGVGASQVAIGNHGHGLDVVGTKISSGRTTDFTTTSTTQVTVTGVSVNIPVAGTYYFRCAVLWKCSATGASAMTLGINGPTATQIRINFLKQQPAIVSASRDTYGDSPHTPGNIDLTCLTTIEGGLIVTGTGALFLRGFVGVGTTTLTILAGTVMEVTRIS